MPGILPMKVIKVGTTSQARIAQACDRCRSKKIRCDGLAPTCGQCTNVGFECKTSDKLSRRAFPRGYTESLEDRVRALESEVRELKDLLDEKDEKIDMLSKIHAQAPSPARRASSPYTQATIDRRSSSVPCDRSETFKTHQPSSLLRRGDAEGVFMGNSSGRAFIDAFTRKFHEAGKSCPDFDSGCFYPAQARKSPLPRTKESRLWRPPPRMMSDQLVNIYFQEWAPLFPVLHRPTFLDLYERYTSNPAAVTDKCSLAQLSLVFGIAAASSETRTSYPIDLFEKQWTNAMESFMLETSIKNLQCLVLALLFCVQRGDSSKLLHYKGLAVSVAQGLGLNMSQKRFAFGALTVETRKRVFWTLYTLDCFTSAALGLPKLLREDDVHCEYPVDADDEYVTEEGFKPTLPGESTKISSGLALFRGSRLLAKVLEQNYPASTSHDLSLRDISELDEQLREWQEALPNHLRMEFVHDKPSVQVMNSRGPLLCLTYHYIRTLIHRPVVLSTMGDKASSSLVSLASSSKCMIQILQLLEERNLAFSFCLNKNELLTLSGFGILFQALDLDKDSKLMKDNGKSFCSIAEALGRRIAPGTAEFKRIGCSLLSVLRTNDRQEFSKKAADVADFSLQTQKQLQALAARYNVAADDQKPQKSSNLSAVNTSALSAGKDLRSENSHSSTSTINTLARRPSSQSPRSSTSGEAGLKTGSTYHLSRTTSYEPTSCAPSLDFFTLDNSRRSIQPRKSEMAADEPAWEKVLNGCDDSYLSSHSPDFMNDLAIETLLAPNQLYQGQMPPPSTYYPNWTTDFWGYGSHLYGITPQPVPQSVLSFSDESLTSAEDFSSVDLGSAGKDLGCRGLVMPHYSPDCLSPQELSDFKALHALAGL